MRFSNISRLFGSSKNRTEAQVEQAEAEAASTDQGVAPEVVNDSLEPDLSQLGPLAQLTPFSPAVVGMLRLFEKEDVEISELAHLAESDPALTLELLKLVNSGVFSLPSPVTSPAHAAKLMGLDLVLALATTVATRTLLRLPARTTAVRRLWRHSMATSAIAAELAPAYGLSKDQAQAAGILHDLGRIGLVTVYPEAYAGVAEKTYATPDAILQAEHAEWEMDHCEAGLRLGAAWRLPRTLQQVIERHHQSLSGQDMVSLIHASCRLADDGGFVAIHCGGPADIPATVKATVPEGLREKVSQRLPEIQKRAAKRVESIDL